MNDPRWVVTSVTPHSDYTLDLVFADGKQGTFDFSPLLDRRYYASLVNPGLFKQAHVEGDTVVWNDNIDVAPEILYDECVEREIS